MNVRRTASHRAPPSVDAPNDALAVLMEAPLTYPSSIRFDLEHRPAQPRVCTVLYTVNYDRSWSHCLSHLMSVRYNFRSPRLSCSLTSPVISAPRVAFLRPRFRYRPRNCPCYLYRLLALPLYHRIRLQLPSPYAEGEARVNADNPSSPY